MRKGIWVRCRCTWDDSRREYVTEQTSSDDDTSWEPYDPQNDCVSITYIGGPEDGLLIW